MTPAEWVPLCLANHSGDNSSFFLFSCLPSARHYNVLFAYFSRDGFHKPRTLSQINIILFSTTFLKLFLFINYSFIKLYVEPPFYMTADSQS